MHDVHYAFFRLGPLNHSQRRGPTRHDDRPIADMALAQGHQKTLLKINGGAAMLFDKCRKNRLGHPQPVNEIDRKGIIVVNPELGHQACGFVPLAKK